MSLQSHLIILLTTSYLGLTHLLAQNTTPYKDLQKMVLQAPPDTQQVNLLNQLANYYKYEKLQEGLEYSQQAIKLSQKLNYKSGLAKAYLRAGTIYTFLSQYDTSLVYLDKGLKLFEQLRDTLYIAKSLNYLGYNYDYQGLFPKALNYYFQSLKLYEQIDDIEGIGGQLNNIAAVHYMRGEYESSQKYYFQSLQQYRKLNKPKLIALVLNNLGSTHKRLKNYPKAIEYYQESYEIRKKIQDKKGMSAITSNIGLMYMEDKNYPKAEEFILKSLILSKQLEIPTDIVESQINLIVLYLDWGKAKSAQAYLDSALALAQKAKLADLEMKVYRWYANWGENNGNYQLGYQYLEKFVAQRDSLFNLRKSEQIADLETKYETEKKEALLIKEQNKNILLEQKNKLQHMYLIVSILFALLFLGFVFLFRYNYLTKQKANQLLNQKNYIIEKALTEKEVLIREIHHRVKNNLQIISSLLTLQSKHIQDPTAAAAVREGHDRVQSMALIHQKLYQQEDLSRIDIAQYLDELLESLMHSYDTQSKDIQLKTQIVHDLQLDVNVVIPLGLIINELVSNCLKHAFPDGQPGQIQVSLQQESNKIQLEVIDNGIGLAKDLDWKQVSSFGLKLVQSLASKLQAEVSIQSQNGTQILLRQIQASLIYE